MNFHEGNPVSNIKFRLPSTNNSQKGGRLPSSGRANCLVSTDIFIIIGLIAAFLPEWLGVEMTLSRMGIEPLISDWFWTLMA